MSSSAPIENSRRRFSARRFLIAGGTTAVGLVGAWLLLTGKPDPVASAPEAARRLIVDVVVAIPEDRSLTVTSQGTVEAEQRIELAAQVGGRVVAVGESFDDGSFFNEGELLLQLETADYEFAIARAKSQVAAAEQRLAEERGRNRQAQREWRDLGSEDANALFLRQPQMKAAEAALEGAIADQNAAELALERATIRAPFAGRVERARVDLGQYLVPGTPVADIYATDGVEVRLPLADSQLALVDLGQLAVAGDYGYPVTLVAKFAGREWSWAGTVSRTEAVIDRASRVVYVIAEVESPFSRTDSQQPVLAPGMFVQAEIQGRVLKGLVELPATALRGDNSVLVVSPEGQLSRQEVEVVKRSPEQVWVVGLAAGTQVVAEQNSNLFSGQQVEVAEMRS